MTYKIGVTFICVCALFFCTSDASGENNSIETRRFKNDDVYKIFSAALTHYSSNETLRKLGIVGTTISYRDLKCLDSEKDSPEWRSALFDLKLKNTFTYEVEPKFQLPFEYHIVSKLQPVGGVRRPPAGVAYVDHIKQQMDTLERWSREGYSEVAVSAPGISNDGQLAIVYVEISFSGVFFELHTAGSEWVVFPKAHCGWIS